MKQAPYGTWESPLSAAQVAAAGRRIADVVLDGGEVYWGETRPEEGGRVTIMRRSAKGKPREILPAPFSARTRVHEYGGGAFTVAGGIVYFSNQADQRLYRLVRNGKPEPITPAGAWRYADGVVDAARNRIVCVGEDHSGGGHEPVNAIVAVDLGNGAVDVLASGADFYACPRLSPAGDKLCWIEWDHPQMPWDGTRLKVARITRAGRLGRASHVAGGTEEAVCAALWSPAGVLHFVSDRSGWWNLYRRTGGKVRALWPHASEFGLPHWSFGAATFGFDGEDVVCIHGPPGARRLARIATAGGQGRDIDLPWSELGSLRVDGGRAVLVTASPEASPALVEIALATAKSRVVQRPGGGLPDAALVSSPEAIVFPTPRGDVHAFHYLPRNPGFTAPAVERPPLIVISHGGPTGATSTAYSSGIQFWTTRGFAVLDVNYGGSSGYGRAYRKRLDGAWGIVDVEDCIAGARFLVARGDVDGGRLLIRGGSAGGYTTLCALTFHDVFRAGASYYGIGDLEALARDTHKFEARYLDSLVGPYPARRDLYVARSPIHHVDGLACPVIFFQGLEDKVVPPAQAEAMVAALRAKRLAVAYVPFEGEQHGFRKAENVTRALEAELYFYGRVLGFEPDGDIAPVEIANLPTASGKRPRRR